MYRTGSDPFHPKAGDIELTVYSVQLTVNVFPAETIKNYLKLSRRDSITVNCQLSTVNFHPFF